MLYLILKTLAMFDVWKPVSPMLEHVDTKDWVAIFFKIVYLEDCDKFVVEKVLKFNVETWEEVE